jgi:hypothetical protein
MWGCKTRFIMVNMIAGAMSAKDLSVSSTLFQELLKFKALCAFFHSHLNLF